MSEALTCPQCGGPLPPGEPGTTVTCAHCGTPTILEGPGDKPHEAAPRGSGSLLGGVAVWGILVLAAMGVVGVLAVLDLLFVEGTTAMVAAAPTLTKMSSAPTEATPNRATPAEATPAAEAAPTPEPPSRLPWTALSTAEPGEVVKIDPPPTTTPFTAFEPLQHLEWAEKIGRAWSPDAIVVRMDADGVRADGTLDLVHYPEARLRYELTSPSREAAADELAKVSHDTTPTGMTISWDDGIEVIIGGHVRLDRDAVPPMRTSCTLKQTLDALGKDLKARPDHSIRFDWRTPYSGLSWWTLDVDSGGEVFADDCTRWDVKAARRKAASR